MIHQNSADVAFDSQPAGRSWKENAIELLVGQRDLLERYQLLGREHHDLDIKLLQDQIELLEGYVRLRYKFDQERRETEEKLQRQLVNLNDLYDWQLATSAIRALDAWVWLDTSPEVKRDLATFGIRSMTDIHQLRLDGSNNTALGRNVSLMFFNALNPRITQAYDQLFECKRDAKDSRMALAHPRLFVSDLRCALHKFLPEKAIQILSTAKSPRDGTLLFHADPPMECSTLLPRSVCSGSDDGYCDSSDSESQHEAKIDPVALSELPTTSTHDSFIPVNDQAEEEIEPVDDVEPVVDEEVVAGDDDVSIPPFSTLLHLLIVKAGQEIHPDKCLDALGQALNSLWSR
ncbi:hypothetical protein C8J56DRAFT_329315 [Mycena floridula]|nr:hypothetical protein C8J56DRAFT_329315 [Mycena floridula]